MALLPHTVGRYIETGTRADTEVCPYSLNPFEIRASLKREPPSFTNPKLPGLNPFEIRASLKVTKKTLPSRLPRLNPFEIRASLKPR